MRNDRKCGLLSQCPAHIGVCVDSRRCNQSDTSTFFIDVLEVCSVVYKGDNGDTAPSDGESDRGG